MNVHVFFLWVKSFCLPLLLCRLRCTHVQDAHILSVNKDHKFILCRFSDCVQSVEIDLQAQVSKVDLFYSIYVDCSFAIYSFARKIFEDTQTLFFSVNDGNLGIICRSKQGNDARGVIDFSYGS